MRFNFSRVAAGIVAAAAALAGGVLVSAAEIDGTVDTSFASDGVAYVEGVGYSKMALDSEGRFLLASGIDDDPDAAGPDLIRVSRLTADGTPDTSFGTNGSTDISGLQGWSYLQLMTLMVDGQDRPVVIMGANGLPQAADTGAVVRFTEAGALDTSFGGDGYAVLTAGSARSNMAPYIGFIDATSGNIYALGGINGVDLYRVSAAGAQDTSFFGDGVVDFDYYYEPDVPLFDMGFGFRGNPVALSVDSDESGATVALTKSVSDVARLLMIKIDFSADETMPLSRTWGSDNYGIPTTYTNGSISVGADQTPDGVVDTGVPLLELVRAKILSDGSLVAWMTGQSDPYATRVARVDGDGNLLSSFSSNGYTDELELFDSYLQPELVVNGDGSFSLIGKTDDYSVLARVVRFSSDGSLDASFGTDGRRDLSACERGSLQSAVRSDSGSVYVLSNMSDSTSDGETLVVSRITKLGAGGSSTVCGTTTSSPGLGGGGTSGGGGGGGGSGYTPPAELDPAPVYSVGEADGGLLVCVDVNGSAANYVSVNVFPSDFDYPDSGPPEVGSLMPSTWRSYMDPDLGVVNGPVTYVDWAGGDLGVLFTAQTFAPYSMDGPADPSTYVDEPFEVGAAYEVWAFASQYENGSNSPVAESFPDEPLTYTFTGEDVDCGVEPGVGSSSESSTTTVQAPTLVTAENQAALTSTPGSAKILINGELVEVDLVQAPEELRRSVAGARSFAQVQALQSLARDMVAAVQAVLGEGVTLPITIQNTSTGATISGLVTDPVTGVALAVPVEDVLLIVNESIALMVGGADGAGDPANIAFDGVLEFGEGGYVAVLAYGLTPGAAGEVVVMSTPRLLDSFAVGADGGVAVQAQIPTDLAAGDHTVVVAIDGQSASLGFRVLAPGILPSTGSDSPVSFAVLVLAMGAFAALMVTRRRNVI